MPSLDASQEESNDAIIAISFPIKYKLADINKLFYNIWYLVNIILVYFFTNVMHALMDSSNNLSQTSIPINKILNSILYNNINENQNENIF